MSKIGFIGAGNMAQALMGGILRDFDQSKNVIAHQVYASDVNHDILHVVKQKFPLVCTSFDNKELARECDVLFLSVKPQKIDEVLIELGRHVGNKLVVSIAAGVTIAKLQQGLVEARVIRVMPNTPCLVSEGMSALCYSDNVAKSDIDLIQSILNLVGETVVVEERLINAVTGLSGSGPAFVYEIAKALILGGTSSGLTEADARKLAAQTMVGAGKMLLEGDDSIDDMVRMVASPGGTTEAGLKVLASSDWQQTLTDAVVTAKNRADELSVG